MTTSNPNVTPPAGGGEHDPDAPVQGEEGGLVDEQLEGSGPPDAQADPDTETGAPTDSTDADRKRSEAG